MLVLVANTRTRMQLSIVEHIKVVLLIVVVWKLIIKLSIEKLGRYRNLNTILKMDPLTGQIIKRICIRTFPKTKCKTTLHFLLAFASTILDNVSRRIFANPYYVPMGVMTHCLEQSFSRFCFWHSQDLLDLPKQ